MISSGRIAYGKSCVSIFFQKYVRPTDTVLEIASGYGEFSRHIRAARKVAIDLNPESADFLPTDAEFHLGSAADLSAIEAASIDICFSSNFFEHLPSKNTLDRVLKEVLRVLKPGGYTSLCNPTCAMRLASIGITMTTTSR